MPFYAKLKKCLVIFLLLRLPASVPADENEGVSRPYRHVVDGAVAALYAEDDGTLYCVTDGSSILRVNSDMTGLWTRRMGGRPAMVFRRQDGVIIAATERGRVEGYSRLGDRVIDFALPWEDLVNRAKGQTAASLLLDIGETEEGWTYIFTVDGRCAVLSRGGELLSRWNTPKPPACAPLVYRGKIVCALEDGSLAAWSPSGRPAWNIEAAAPAVLLAENPYTRTLAVARKGGRFEIHTASPEENPAAGTPPLPAGSQNVSLLLRRTLPFEITHILPLASGGHVLVGGDGRIITLNTDGDFTQDFFLKTGRPKGVTTDGQNAIFLAEDRGQLSSYSLAGSPLWTTTLTGKPGKPSQSPSSRYLAVGTEDWVVQRFEFVQYGRNLSRAAPPAVPPDDTLKVPLASSVYRGEYDFIYFMDRAASETAENKKECLAIAGERFEKGGLNLSLDYINEVLRYLAAEPYTVQGAKSYADVRSRALELLALTGDAGTRSFLSAFLAQEKDSFLLLGILAAMGRIGSDPDEVMRAGIFRCVQARPETDTRLASAITDALDRISLYQGGLGQYGRAALMQLQSQVRGTLRQRIGNLIKSRP